jgi:hypothetical protein
MTRTIESWLWGFMLVLSADSVRAQDSSLSADDVIERALAHNAFGFENAVARMTLKLTNRRGNESVREIEIRSKEKESVGKTLVRFHAPADVAGTGFLVLEKLKEDDEQYLYLPALGKVKRISSRQRGQRFMGTDLTYADLESRNLKEGHSKRLADAFIGPNDCFLIESLSKEGSESQYGKTLTWIHKVSFVPLKVEFYDRKLKQLKTLKVKRLEKKSGHWLVMDSEIKNHQRNTKTRMIVDHIELNTQLPDSAFSTRALQKG